MVRRDRLKVTRAIGLGFAFNNLSTVIRKRNDPSVLCNEVKKNLLEETILPWIYSVLITSELMQPSEDKKKVYEMWNIYQKRFGHLKLSHELTYNFENTRIFLRYLCQSEPNENIPPIQQIKESANRHIQGLEKLAGDKSGTKEEITEEEINLLHGFSKFMANYYVNNAGNFVPPRPFH